MVITRVLGVDPGSSSGAAAIFGYDGARRGTPRIIGVADIPTKGDGASKRIDVLSFQDWIMRHDPQVAYIENAMAMPDHMGRSMGTATTARYMRAVGAIEATVALCGVDIVLTMPAQWKRRMTLSGPNKADSLTLIRSMYPEAVESWFKLQKHHNRAEAALLSIYGASRCDMIELLAA